MKKVLFVFFCAMCFLAPTSFASPRLLCVHVWMHELNPNGSETLLGESRCIARDRDVTEMDFGNIHKGISYEQKLFLMPEVDHRQISMKMVLNSAAVMTQTSREVLVGSIPVEYTKQILLSNQEPLTIQYQNMRIRIRATILGDNI